MIKVKYYLCERLWNHKNLSHRTISRVVEQGRWPIWNFSFRVRKRDPSIRSLKVNIARLNIEHVEWRYKVDWLHTRLKKARFLGKWNNHLFYYSILVMSTWYSLDIVQIISTLSLLWYWKRYCNLYCTTFNHQIFKTDSLKYLFA